MNSKITAFIDIPFRTKCINIKALAFIVVCLFFGNEVITAATITATSIADLQTKINSAASGDIINLANGHYTNNTISISKTNITVQATTAGGVYLDGTNTITISGNNNTFGGFQFTNGTITSNVVTVTGNNNTITQLNFNGYSASKMLQLEGQYNVVSFCNFQNKPAPNLVNHGGDGDMVQIIPNATNPGYNTIRYCSFQHMPGFGGDFGNECIRIGDGAYSTYISRTVVEYCYFEDTGLGDSEAISVKSMENTLRYNTMNNNPNAMFCFRNGDNNVAYGNFFIRSGGIRCKQSNNVWIYNNYFEMAGTGWDNTLPGSGTRAIYFLTYAGYNNNYNVIHNTFYKCGETEIQPGMTNCTWANNAIYSNSGNIFSSSGTTDGQTFVGNLYSGTLGLTIPSGMVKNDPKLSLNSDGYYGLLATSPAINGASSNYPAMLSIPLIDTLALDIQGQYRPITRTQKDVGCEEYSATGTVLNKQLTVTSVGPSYLGGPATPTLTDQNIIFNSLSSKNVGDANFALGAYATSGLTVSYTSSNTAVATIVSGQIHIVGGGTSIITASQAGNSAYNAATNVTQTLTVNKQNQTITFGTLPTKLVSDADFSASATASSGLTISLSSSNTAVATIVSGQIHIVGAGTTTITASQTGNTSYNAATNVTQTLTVNKLSQTITFGTIASKVTTTADFNPGATASSTLIVTYASSNTAVATIVNNQIHIIGVGTTTITASQAGNASYNAAQDVTQSFTVNNATTPQTITFNALLTKMYGDADFTPGATASSGLTVTYSSSNTTVATIVSNQIHIVGAGTSDITASQTGNGTYNVASNVVQTLTVNKKSQTVTFTALPTKLITDVDFAPGATASSGLTVSYSSSNTAVATIISNQIHITGAGTMTITASQAGDSNNSAATDVQQTLTVNKLSQTITYGSLAKKCTADADFNPGATASSGLAVTYSSSNTSVATIVSGLVHIVGAGVSTITASQSGSSSYNTATNVVQSLTVEEVTNVSITLNPAADTYVYGTNTTTNYGTLTDLVSKKGSNSTGDRIIYTQFDISGQNIYSISSAKVRLYANSVSGPTTVTVSQATDNWTETGITYANCPGKGTDITSVSIPTVGAYYEWDITSYIQSQFAANDNLISLVFNNTTADGIIVKFNSKEATSNIPQLYITLNKIVTRVSGAAATSSLTLTPTSDVKVLSGGLLTIDTPTSVKSINVASGGKLTQNSGQTLNVGALTIQSDATGTGTFVDNNTTNLQTKTATVQQYLTAGRNWYISSPVAGATSNVFSASSLYPLYWYDEAHGSTAPWGTIINTSTQLSVMQGYVAKMASDGVVPFNGTLNNGSQSVNIYRTTGQTKEGFNLVGNPFISYLDWDQVSKTNLQTSIWQRTKNAGNNYVFDTYNSTGQQYLNNSGKGINNHIPPMQAFWVRVSNGFSSGSLTVDNTMRSHNGNANILGSTVNDPVFKSSSSKMESQKVLRLQVSTGSNTDETLIYSNPSASNGFDTYDTPKMFNDSGAIAEIYTVVGIENVAINGFNILPYDTEIPLGFNSLTAGEFNIKATQIYNFISGTQIILKDYLDINNPVITDLSNGSSYLFSSGATSNNISRFSLIFHAPSIETGISNSISNGTGWVSINKNGQISLNGTLKGETNISVYNEVGQKLLSKNFTDAKQTIDYQLIPGIYIVTVINAGKSKISKVIVN